MVLAVLALGVTRVLPAVGRGLKLVRAGTGGDPAAWLLARAVEGLPGDRADWGQAMLIELAEVRGAGERWRFSLGCIRAVVALRITTAMSASLRAGRTLRALVLGAIAVAVALAAYGLVRYPGLRSGTGPWAAGAFLVVVLLAYGATTLALSHGTTRPAVIARRHGLIGGLIGGAAWLIALHPTGPLKEWVFVPLAIAVLGPAALSVHTRRATRDARAATAAAAWSGIVGGLLAFVVLVTATYLRDAGPYDPQLVRDFHHSHSHDLVAYAISDDVGTALGLLLLIPLVAVAFGSIGGRSAATGDRHSDDHLEAASR